jgi:hypothetical protein
MKFFAFVFGMLVFSCAYGPSFEPEQTPSLKIEITENAPQDNRRICRKLVSRQEIDSCLLFTFECEDGEKDFKLACPDFPIGEVTDTPRPI